MKIEVQAADDVLLQAIGERLAKIRLARNLTQEQVAVQAGLGLRTVQRLETGAAATQLSGFVRVCRVLGLLERLELLLPEETVSPITQLKLHGKTRQRARGGTKPAAAKAKKWTWGEPS